MIPSRAAFVVDGASRLGAATRRPRGGLVLLLVAVSAGCGRGDAPSRPAARPAGGAAAAREEPRAAWPAFPADERAARRLIATSRSAATAAIPTLDATRLAAQVRASVQDGTAIAGEDAIGAWIRDRLAVPRDVYLLFGVFHDSGLQIDLIRRLVGPVYQTEAIAVAAELFRADGRWSGVPPAEQKGDDELIGRYVVDGDRRASSSLLERQRAQNYTAWKYGYLPQVLDLAQQVRASGGSLSGCDVPPGLAGRLAALGEETRLRVRELHCVLHLRDAALAPPRRVALIWGGDHLGAEGLRRFLPASAESWAVHLVGGRVSDSGIEATLALGMRITDPLLVPLGERDLALLLPAPPLGFRMDRRREDLDAPLEPSARGRVSLQASIAGRVSWGSRSSPVRAGEAVTFDLQVGDHALLWESGGRSIVFALHMPAAGAVEVDVVADAISTLQRLATRTSGR